MRVVLYTGKGGVGKTTTSAATAAHAAARGRRVLVVSADAAHSLGDVLGEPVGPEPREMAPGLFALEVDARAETERHWGSVRRYLVDLFRYQGIEEVVADELALLPGAEELTTLLAVEEHARHGGYDLVVVDCAPTDSALRLLTLPDVARNALQLLLRIQRAVSRVVTPLAQAVVPMPLPDAAVFRDAEDLLYKKLRRLRALVTDDDTTTRLVVTPERMVIDEGLRAHTDLVLFELRCDAVVMNRLLPAEAAAEPFFEDWMRVQREREDEVRERFAPLPILRGTLASDEVQGVADLAAHGAALFAGLAPEAVLCEAPGLRFESTGAGARLSLPLPHARAADLDVAKLDDQLILRVAGRRRTLPLPRHLRRLELGTARLVDGRLELSFDPAPDVAPSALARDRQGAI